MRWRRRSPRYREGVCATGRKPGQGDNCQLCSADRVTAWHFEDDRCWVADCIVCATPMIVWRRHGLPSSQEEQSLLEILSEVATARYPAGFWIDPERRRIPDHWHAHARPAGGFFDPSRPQPGWHREGPRPH
jgi:hypothetical protein